jgi:hypothetical protein
VDGLGQTIRERLFAIEVSPNNEPRLQDLSVLGNLIPSEISGALPAIADAPEAMEWLQSNLFAPFLEEVRAERLSEVARIEAHVELSLTELLQKADEEIGRVALEIDQRIAGAEGRAALAQARHAELLKRRDRRRRELAQQRSLSLQAVERIACALILPHPERESAEVRHLRPNFETEAIAMKTAMEFEKSQGRQPYDVHEKNLGYDITSLDLNSGELRLIEVKGLGAASGTILLTPNERRVAEDRRDCYWLYVVINCARQPELQEPIRDPARFPWHEVTKVSHYWLEVNAMTRPMRVCENSEPYKAK